MSALPSTIKSVLPKLDVFNGLQMERLLRPEKAFYTPTIAIVNVVARSSIIGYSTDFYHNLSQ